MSFPPRVWNLKKITNTEVTISLLIFPIPQFKTSYLFLITAEDGSCKFNASKVIATISNWTYVTNNNTGEDETKMVNALYSNGPISVCVDAETCKQIVLVMWDVDFEKKYI